MRLIKSVDDNKAERFLRFLNFIIDLICGYIITFACWLIGIFIYTLVTDSSYAYQLQQLENLNSTLDRLVTVCIYTSSMVLIEFLTKGRSLGKLITGTKVVMIDGSKPTFMDFVKRNYCRAIPFEIFSFFGVEATGWHDTISDTRVVKRNAFEKAMIQTSELDEIGNVAL